MPHQHRYAAYEQYQSYAAHIRMTRHYLMGAGGEIAPLPGMGGLPGSPVAVS